MDRTSELLADAHRRPGPLLLAASADGRDAREDEGGSKVTPKQALAACLRMKPDRILLAELRGDEAWEFVKSVNTGHPGSITTMHANGAYEAFEQLAAFIKDSSGTLRLSSIFPRTAGSI